MGNYRLIIAILLFFITEIIASIPSKAKIDSSSRLYIEAETGRYRIFHGLALENSGEPWYYATYSSEQIKLLKQVLYMLLST